MVGKAFTWGAGGAQLTPEDIALQRAVLARRRAQGADTSPVGHWTAGLARVADAIGDVVQERRLGAAQAENDAYNTGPLANKLNDVASSLYGGSSIPSASSTGVGQELAATSPAPVVAEGEIADYIRQAATARGIDPNIALRVAMSEGGLKDPVRQSDYVKNGVREASYGPFQLYMGGGLGNKALEAGIDPRDPNQWRAGVDFALDQAAKVGWSPWYGAAKAGIGNRDGLSGARAIGYGQSAAPTPAAAAIETVAPASGYVDPMVIAPNYQPSAEVANALLGPSSFDAGRFGGNAPEIYSAASDFVPEQPAPVNVASPPRVASVPTQVAQSSPPRMGFDPRVIAVLNDPRANENTRNMAKLLLDQQMAEQQAAQKQYLAEQQRQQEIARRQQIAQQAGINPAYAADDELWKAAAGNVFAAPSTSTANGQIVDNRTGKVIYSAPQQPTTGMQDYQSYADYETKAGRTPLGPLEYEQALRSSGAARTNIDTGTIPPGYQANRDADGRITSLAPIPGGPEDKSKNVAAQNDQNQNAADVIRNSAVRAVQAITGPGLPATGFVGKAASLNPNTNAAELRRQVGVLRSNGTLANLQALKASGAGLGAASDSDLLLLANKSGALDPDSPTIERDIKEYVQSLYRAMYGVEDGDKAFGAINWSQNGDVPTDLPGVTIRRKGQ